MQTTKLKSTAHSPQRRRVLGVGAGSVVAGLLAPLAHASPASAGDAAERWVVSGRVVGPDASTPMAGVSVSLGHDDGAGIASLSDGDGRFLLVLASVGRRRAPALCCGPNAAAASSEDAAVVVGAPLLRVELGAVSSFVAADDPSTRRASLLLRLG